MDTITGHIERITFQNSDTGFTVAVLQQPGKKETTCIVGTLPGLQPGETIRCIGSWQRHLVHGSQFSVHEYKCETPADIAGITKYLGSGLVKGIGPKFASKIVDAFGTETLNVIDSDPDRLLEVEGIGKKRVERLKSCWNAQKSIREVMVFLQSHGVSTLYAQKIFKIYGSHSIQKVKDNPYSLARDIKGIGFKSADKIALTLNIAKESPQRVDAGIEHLLSSLSDEGHVCYPLNELKVLAQEILEVSSENIEGRLFCLKEEKRIDQLNLFIDGVALSHIWIKSLFVAEVGIAREIIRLTQSKCHLRQVDIAKALIWVQNELKIELADNQKEAVALALTDKLHIITGGPGTGKSTITNAILHVSAKLTGKISLAAPTGRAAKRLSEITKRPASTIHSLLQFDFKNGKFKHNRENPLDCDLIVIDESSMLDTYLMYSLLKAIPKHARVIFVGDICQLPSVGPGNVLKDLIHSKCTSVTTLNKIFRQAEGSRIITNAHRINQGLMPEVHSQHGSDFFFIHAEKPEDVLSEIVNLVSQRLPRKYGFDPFAEIQVLAPMKKGIVGTFSLNEALQQALNSKAVNPVLYSGMKYFVGDKVMQIRNNYTKNVFNGDIGRIVEIDSTEQTLIVSIDGRDVLYDFADLDELIHSYAVSIHKYQGSECPCIVMPIHTTHFKLLTRNLLYTAVTRGKKLVVLVGMQKAIAIAVRNDDVKKRFTGLQQALIELTRAPLP